MVFYATVPILIMEARWESVVRSRSIQQAYVQLGFEISLSSAIFLSQTHSCPLLNLLVHSSSLSPSHTSPLSTQETPNSITGRQQWEADSAAQVQLQGILMGKHVKQMHHGIDFTTALTAQLSWDEMQRLCFNYHWSMAEK